MSWSKEKNQKFLRQLYGVDFPDSLFWLHEFLVSNQYSSNLRDLELHPTGVLQLLLEFPDLSQVKLTNDAILHWRFYRDVPEFFTCLHGHCDGEHWGLLLDEPSQGFRGVASYYNNDGDDISIYKSLFDAVLCICDREIEGCQEYAEETEDEEEIAEYCDRINVTRQLRLDLESFIEANSIILDEGRGSGIKSDTGLDLILPKGFDREKHGSAIASLIEGRSLWYWYGETESDRAYSLLKNGYELLERNELIRILELHYHNRDLDSVDLIE
jgi:hypothetical protein